jgi:hypothetical protein
VLVGAWPALYLRLANGKIVKSQETSQPCFGETLTVFEFMSRILFITLMNQKK